MRNLRNVHRSLLESPHGLQLTASTWDVETNSVICAFGPCKGQALLQLKRWNNPAESPDLVSAADDALNHIASWDAPCPNSDLECDEILDLHYFSDTSIVCLVLAGGDIVVVREDPQIGEDKIEIVGSVDVGISAAVWSPDEELLAITTRASTFLYMTRDFENVTDITFSYDDLKASKHVSVGWGKTETQFKGKRARALRDPTMPETVDEGTLNEFDKNDTTISWRGDGAYVAVNSIESNLRRVVRVYSREGTLDSASEPVDGLVGALSWRPAGNLLAGIQRHKDHIDVVFFERNGLRHGQFPLRLTEDEITSSAADISLTWNIDSSVLAVCLKDRVQLWSMGNYHYYLKQEIYPLASTSSQKALSLGWHTEKPLRFTLSSEEGIQRFEYNPVVCNGPTTPPDDYGIVAVIDGKNLKVTSMRLANVPPPMALHELSLSENACDVTVNVVRINEIVAFIGVLHRESISLYEWALTAKPPTPPSLRWLKKIPLEGYLGFMQQQVAFNGEELFVLASAVNGSFVRILDRKSGSILEEISFANERFRGLIGYQTKLDSDTCLLLRVASAVSFSRLESNTNDLRVVRTLGGFLNSSPRVEAVRLQFPQLQLPQGSSQDGDRQGDGLVIFGLADNGLLIANERILARNCTSFLVTPAHLIFTTSQHLLKFVHISRVEELEVPPDTPELDERCRSIERGARLVTVMPSIFALVMQMPRGNLETIYPRALVLAGIRHSINIKRYKRAFLACRSQRVDMNILHDHDPAGFLANIGLFLDQVEKVEHIDLFLSQLREEDVSKSMYKETIGASISGHDGANSETLSVRISHEVSKVNSVCNAFLEVLHDRTPARFQNIVTAHVCKVPPDLDAGLLEIARIREQSPQEADRTVEHICFLTDVNRLYDNALGLYDLELTLLIAQQSQKDPREYLPFLQNLQGMTPLRRQYSIDNHLGRFGKALKHLHSLNVFEEAKSYVLKHDLYVEALELYRYQEDHLAEIMRLYADHLHQISNFNEAGIAYDYLQDYVAASESYRLAHLWKESLACATLIPLPRSQLHSLARTLADALVESKDFFSAATVHLDYLSDVSTAARLFCKGYFFADALRTIGLHQRLDLLEPVIDAGLVEGMSSMTEFLADCKSQLHAQVPRIRELRTKKAEDPLSFFDGDVNGGADIPDNVSLAPTDASTAGGGSLFTRYTNRTGTVGTNATRKTSKNRRREERKRARGKKGSVYEEEYLVNSVGRLVQRVNTVGEDIRRLVIGLTRRGMRERARAVETAMVDLVQLCHSAVADVFPTTTETAVDEGDGARTKPAEEGSGDGGVVGGLLRPKGADGVLWDSLEAGLEKKAERPLLKGFERLSILSHVES